MSARLSVDPLGDWRIYTNTLPEGSEPLGTVTREGADTGALVRIARTGKYVQVNAGTIRTLDGRSVAAALGKSGRPATVAGGRQASVYLDATTIESATKIGAGNLSDGIRIAVTAYPNKP